MVLVSLIFSCFGPTAIHCPSQFCSQNYKVHPWGLTHLRLFLKTLIKLNENGVLYTDLYTKPTDSHSYIHYKSCHPQHQKKGGPYSQLLRVRQIYTRNEDFERNASMILDHYKSRGYLDSLLDESLSRAKRLNRSDLLTPRRQVDTPNDTPLFCILPYNPSYPPVKDLISKERHILDTDPNLACVNNRRVIVGHRSAKNLNDILVHSRLQ